MPSPYDSISTETEAKLMQNIYDEKKAAQVAAFFLFKAQGRLPVLKLVKLLYLAERHSYEKFGEPIIGDKLVSMQHGPVLSQTLDRINGLTESVEGGWETWIADREGHDVALRDLSVIRSARQDLLELSDADLEVLEEIWGQFGHMNKYQIRNYTHDHCPEWEDPNGSSIPIQLDRLFQVLQYQPDEARNLRERLQQQGYIEEAFSRPVAAFLRA
jgi:uncharacterized phage-associated protein